MRTGRPARPWVVFLLGLAALTGCSGDRIRGVAEPLDVPEPRDDVVSYLSGEGPGWYDGVRFLTYTESEGRLTGTFSVVAPDPAQGPLRAEYTLDGFADGDTLTFTATPHPESADIDLASPGTWLGRIEGGTLLLTILGEVQEFEFRPASVEDFHKAAAHVTTLAVQQSSVWTANEEAWRALDEVQAIGERLAALTDYADLLAEYDRNLADIGDAVTSQETAFDCSESSYYRWVVDYELDAIADLDSRRLAADAADVQAESQALAAAQQNAQAAYDALEDAIEALPEGVERTPNATITAAQVQAAADAADVQRQRAASALAAAQQHATAVRAKAESLAVQADRLATNC